MRAKFMQNKTRSMLNTRKYYNANLGYLMLCVFKS